MGCGTLKRGRLRPPSTCMAHGRRVPGRKGTGAGSMLSWGWWAHRDPESLNPSAIERTPVGVPQAAMPELVAVFHGPECSNSWFHDLFALQLFWSETDR